MHQESCRKETCKNTKETDFQNWQINKKTESHTDITEQRFCLFIILLFYLRTMMILKMHYAAYHVKYIEQNQQGTFQSGNSTTGKCKHP